MFGTFQAACKIYAEKQNKSCIKEYADHGNNPYYHHPNNLDHYSIFIIGHQNLMDQSRGIQS